MPLIRIFLKVKGSQHVSFLEQLQQRSALERRFKCSSTGRTIFANAAVPALHRYLHRMTRLLVFLGVCLLSHTVCLGWAPATRPKVVTAGIKTLVGHRLLTTTLQMGEVSPVDSKDVPAIGYMKSEEIIFTDDMTDEWELDCYSRPVMGADGKKLWEILLTDSEGSFRYLKTIPSNLVNSRNLRNAVEEVMEQAPVRPKMIRFFRNQMFNMITIALSTLEVEVKPSRRTHNMFSWLTEREKNIYPKMPGYNAQLKQQTILDYDVSQPDRLPDVLKAESYAFVALPAEAFWDGQVNSENIKKGRLCPIRDLPKTGWIHGITLFSKRSESIAAWMNGLEIAYLRADLLSRELMMNTDISTQFIVAPLMDPQKREAQIFEKGKTAAAGYHFLSVQATPESEDVEGFWLIRQFDNDL